MNSLCARNETWKRHMKFVVVNGRTPRPQSFCGCAYVPNMFWRSEFTGVCA